MPKQEFFFVPVLALLLLVPLADAQSDTTGRPVKEVRLDGPDISDATVKKLKVLKHLKSLEIVDFESRVTDDGIKELKGLTELEQLKLCGCKVTDAGLKELTGLIKLTELDLSRTQVTDAGLKELKKFVKLTELDLTGTQVTDIGLAELKESKNLRVLMLHNTKVSDEGIKQLKPLTELRRLGVLNTRVTKEGLKVFDLRKVKVALLLPNERFEEMKRLMERAKKAPDTRLQKLLNDRADTAIEQYAVISKFRYLPMNGGQHHDAVIAIRNAHMGLDARLEDRIAMGRLVLEYFEEFETQCQQLWKAGLGTRSNIATVTEWRLKVEIELVELTEQFDKQNRK